MEKQSVIQIMNKVLEYTKTNPKQFSESLGFERPQVIYDILNPAKKVGISKNMADKICGIYPSINKVYLLTGEGSLILSSDSTIPREKTGYKTYLIPMSAIGGSLIGFSSTVMLKDCESVVSPIENVDFAISVYGESMSPEYPSGSRVLIKKINPSIFIDWGKTYVLDTPNGVIIKEVHECKDKPGYIKCHSINPDPKFSDFDIPLSEVYGMYRVLMCLSAK